MISDKVLMSAFWTTVVVFVLLFSAPVVLALYPFKTVVFTEPIEILNPDKKVACNGVVEMRFTYKKYVNIPGLTVRTLIRKKDVGEVVLDSTTVVSNLPKGEGTSEATYYLTPNPKAVGKDCQIVFSIYHWVLFGMKPVMVQYKTEPFEIVECPATHR